jgi:hypothetical protein
MTTNNNKRIEVSGAWSALTPALSPRRGRIVRRLPANQVTEICNAVQEFSKAVNRCPLSTGERVRVRASVPLHYKFWPEKFSFYI